MAVRVERCKASADCRADAHNLAEISPQRLARRLVKPRFVWDIWLTYHPDSARIARVRRVIDWVKDSFDARKFPWFGEQFIHPYDLPKAYRGEPLINVFEGFARADGGIGRALVRQNRPLSP